MSATQPHLTQLSSDDPGDDVQRRFRYQHAFGVVLLIASIRTAKDYVAIWCEHHEDFLAETADGKFDAFQVKTRDTGESWKINDDSFCSSIERFARLEVLAPHSIREFSFVTNAKPLETDSADRIHLCPLRLLGAAKAAAVHSALPESNEKALKILADKTALDQELIFAILQRTEFVTSLPLDGFAALVAHEHLANYEPCCHFAAAKLAQIVDRLIFLVFQASSLAVSDPARHYAPLSGVATIPETMMAKRIPSQVVDLAVNELTSPSFRYLAGLATLQPTSPESWSILRRKMARGGIGWQLTSFANIGSGGKKTLLHDLAVGELKGTQTGLPKTFPTTPPPPASSFILIDKRCFHHRMDLAYSLPPGI